jgi:flagella basal body P-ring formation protein FlgA
MTFSVEIQIKDDIVLTSDQNQILLSDFVEDVDTFSLTGMGDIIFGYAPLPGKTMKISVEYVVDKFKRYLNDTDFVLPERDIISVYRSVNAKKVEQISTSDDFEKNTQDLNSGFNTYNREDVETMIFSALEERFNIKFDENLKVDYVGFKEDFFEGEFKQIKLYSQSRKRYMAKIDYYDSSNRLKYIRIVFECSWITDIAVSREDIKRDVLVSDETIRFDQLEFFDYDNPVIFAELPEDFVTKYVIKKDDIIEWRMLEKRAYVIKGQIITAVFDTGSVIVSSQVEVISNAELGQLVKARNLDSGITITGIVDFGPILKIGY